MNAIASNSISVADFKKLLLYPQRKSSQGWRKIGRRKIFARSKWEANYARYLQYLKKNKKIKNWEHEPETFWFHKIKRGTKSYLPDFKVLFKNGKSEFHEVKGFFDKKSLTKINRFRKYYFNEKLILIDGSWFKKNNAKMRMLIKDWE